MNALSKRSTSRIDIRAVAEGVRQEKKARAERDLTEFIRQAWTIIEPGTQYIESWHTGLISEYLHAVDASEILRLIINIPPRYMKSIQTTVCFPAWVWTHNPHKRFVKVSYSDGLSRKHNVLCRDIIRSKWYSDNWGDKYRVKGDTDRQNEFKNTAQGMMYSTSTGGTLTGEGGDIIIVDDPQDPQIANSATEREGSITFFKNILQTRLNDPKKGAIVIIMQRLHENDLTGYVLSEKLGYEHLCLPAEAEKRTIITYPRSKKVYVREEGDILNPERFDKRTLTGLQRAMGSAQYSGQFQQTPTPAAGIIFKREWMGNFFKQAPQTQDIQSWDMAFTKSEGSSKVAGIVMGRHGSNVYVKDMVNDKMTFTESVAAVRTLSGKWTRTRAKVIENKANGAAIIDTLKKEIAGMIEFNPRGSKEERAISVTPYFEAGNIFFADPETNPWVHELINDLLMFPRGIYKDAVDALVQGVLYLMDKQGITTVPPQATTIRDSYWSS